MQNEITTWIKFFQGLEIFLKALVALRERGYSIGFLKLLPKDLLPTRQS